MTQRRLSYLQFDLMATLFINGSQDGEVSPTSWSPKAYLNHTPSRSESATLSKRLSSLIAYGYIEKFGREVKVMPKGIQALWRYAEENRNNINADLLFNFLLAEKNRRLSKATDLVLDEMTTLHNRKPITDEATFSEIRRVLVELAELTETRAAFRNDLLDNLLGNLDENVSN